MYISIVVDTSYNNVNNALNRGELYWTTGWWLTYPSEKYKLVNWDDYSHCIEKNIFQTTNQYVTVGLFFSRPVRIRICDNPTKT